LGSPCGLSSPPPSGNAAIAAASFSFMHVSLPFRARLVGAFWRPDGLLKKETSRRGGSRCGLHRTEPPRQPHNGLAR
jgi:hypothetical protein